MLKLKVGFLLKEGVGASRVFSFDETGIDVGEVQLESLVGDLRLTRTRQGIVVQGHLEAESVTDCTRCLTETSAQFDLDLSEHFLYPPSSAQDGEHAVSEEGVLDLTPILREDAILAIPMHVLCQTECKGLCSQCGQNLNEAQCECDHSAIDPRLSMLKALLSE